MKLSEIGAVGKITKQNATKDAPIGSEFANVKKLGLGSGKPKELDKKARKNSTPNKLFNLGIGKSVTELKIMKPDPKDTLGIKRKDMPQIKKQDYQKFIEYLQKNGAKFKSETVPADELKAMQAEFSDAGVIKQLKKDIDKNYAGKAIIVSEDDYVLDGHHRWLVAKNVGRDLDVFRVNMPAYELFDLVNEFEKVYYKDITNERGSIGVPLSSGLTVSIFPHRPLKIKKPTKGKLNYDEARGSCWRGYQQLGMKKKGDRMVPNCVKEDVTQADLNQLEQFADKLFGKVGIDVEFTRHFLDRVNDERNRKPITPAELTRLFKQEYKRYGKPIAKMGPDKEAVMKDLQTNLNLPFALVYDRQNNELDLIAKTIMRKDDFKTPNKVFAVEVEDMKIQDVIDEDLRDWFKQKWVNIGAKKKGGGHPECGTSGKKKGYAKCVPASKAASMTKKEKESAVRRKRAAQNKKGRGGKKSGSGKGKKPIRVSTKTKKKK